MRSVIYLIYMFVFSIVIGIVGLPALLKRDWSIGLSKFWSRGLLGGLRVLCGVNEEIVGIENVPSGPCLVAAKHESMWETLRLMILLERPSFVLKKELRQWPIFSWYCLGNGFIFIDRDAGSRSLRDMTMQAKARVAEGHQIVIFPEGTRSEPGELLPLQPGVAALAKALRIPTLPITHNSGRCWKQPGPQKAPGTVTLKIFPPLTEVSDRRAYLGQLEDMLGDSAGLERA